MLDNYEGMRFLIIKELEIEKDHYKCIQLCKTYINQLKHEDKSKYLGDDLFIAYYNMAVCYKKLDDIDNALKNATIANQFVFKDQYDYRYVKCLWLMAETNIKLNNIKEALSIYCKCSRIFKKNNQRGFRLCMSYNKAKLHNNTEKMLVVIKLYEEYISNLENCSEIELAKNNNSLQGMYLELVDVYISNNENSKIFSILHNIENFNLKKIIFQKMSA